jgi:hypothetical protein
MSRPTKRGEGTVARLIAAMRGLTVVVLALVILAVTPSAAGALSCVDRGALNVLQAQPVAFIGEVVEDRRPTVVFRVQEGIKGVATGAVIEVIVDRWGPPDQVHRAGHVAALFAHYTPEGVLRSPLCFGTDPETMRAAAGADRRGESCKGPPPRITSVRTRSERRRVLLQIRVADGAQRVEKVRVEWGDPFAPGAAARATRRVTPARTLRLVHRYARRGRVRIRVIAIPERRPLCDHGPWVRRDISVRVRS